MVDLDAYFSKPRSYIAVYELPEKVVDGYCFGGGNPITFLNVDWFEAVEDQPQDEVRVFIMGKRYWNPAKRYLVLSKNPSFTFTIEKVK